MKLLTDTPITVEEGNIKVTIKPPTTRIQARLLDFGVPEGFEANLEMASFILENCVDSLQVDGESFDPVELSKRADVSDADTVTGLMMIGTLVFNNVILTAEDEGKS